MIAHFGDGGDVLVVEGHTAIVRDADELTTVDRLFRQKYVDPHSGATAGYPQSDVDVPFRINIERIMIWCGVVSTRTDFVPDSSGGMGNRAVGLIAWPRRCHTRVTAPRTTAEIAHVRVSSLGRPKGGDPCRTRLSH